MRFLLTAFALLLAAPAAAQPIELNILTPGVVYNAGVQEFAAGFAKETGIKVNVKSSGMAKITGDIKTGTPVADVVFLPLDLMDALEKDGGIKAGSRLALGRVNIGLAIHKGDAVPDISTTAKLAAVLKAADSVIYSNPESGSMEARIADGILKRPEFVGVKKKISHNGEGGEALVRGEAQMSLQLICEIVNHPELANAGPIPEELGGYIDTATAISARSAHPREAAQFIKYITQPGGFSLWYSRGLMRARN